MLRSRQIVTKLLSNKTQFKYDQLPQELYFINQRDANLSRFPVTLSLKALQRANHGALDSGNSDEVIVVGLPYGTPKGEIPEYDTWSRIAAQYHPDLVFLQMDPCAYIARQRFLAHKCALNEVDEYDLKDTLKIDPIKPFTWEECVVNPLLLDMLDKNQMPDKLELTEGLATYAYPDVQNKQIRDHNKKKFIESIGEHVVGRNYSPFYPINTILYTCDMPEQLLRMKLGNTLEIQEFRDLFKYVLKQTKEMEFPTSFKKSSIDLLPHVFQAPRDLYMTAMLMRAFEAAETITAFVGLHHVSPIDNYWIRPPEGINYTEATHTHQRIIGETDEQQIEKQAIMDVMLESTTWAERYLSNPFPYIFEDVTKVSKVELEGMKKCFFNYYQKYSAFKQETQREISNLRSDQEIRTLGNYQSLLALPDQGDAVNIKAFMKQQEMQKQRRFKLQKLA